MHSVVHKHIKKTIKRKKKTGIVFFFFFFLPDGEKKPPFSRQVKFLDRMAATADVKEV